MGQPEGRGLSAVLPAAARSLDSLRRVGVGVSLVLSLGVAASITANVLHEPRLVGAEAVPGLRGDDDPGAGWGRGLDERSVPAMRSQ